MKVWLGVFFASFLFFSCQLNKHVVDYPEAVLWSVNSPLDGIIYENTYAVSGVILKPALAQSLFLVLNPSGNTQTFPLSFESGTFRLILSNSNLEGTNRFFVRLQTKDGRTLTSSLYTFVLQFPVYPPQLLPQLFIDSPTNGSKVGVNPILNGSVSNVEIPYALWYQTKNSWSVLTQNSLQWTLNINLTNEGIYTQLLFVQNFDGQSSRTNKRIFEVSDRDTVLPTLSIVSPTSGSVLTQKAYQVILALTDTNSGITGFAYSFTQDFYFVSTTQTCVTQDLTVLMPTQITNRFYVLNQSGNSSLTQSLVLSFTDTTPPVLSITPSSSTHTQGVELTMTVSDDWDSSPQVYYTTNGYLPTQGDFVFRSPLLADQTTTIFARALDAWGNWSGVVTNKQLIINTNINALHLYFYNVQNWTNVFIHYWNTTNTNDRTSILQTAWPGLPMTAIGNGWYSFLITNATASSVIFNGTNQSGGIEQTVNLSRNSDGWFLISNSVSPYTGNWTDQNPFDTIVPMVSFVSPTNGSIVSGILTMQADASDNIGVVQVDFYINGHQITNLNTSPYTFSWDSTLWLASTSADLLVVARDAAGNTNVHHIQITGQNDAVPPIAEAGRNRTIYLTNGISVVTLDGSQSFDPDGNIVSYEWSDGVTTVDGISNVLIYNDVSTNTITLVVTDNDGKTSTNSFVVKVYPRPFDWKNATVYFVFTDRFYNGDPSNDESYGRTTNDAWGQNYGTFHGGDLQGLIDKLNDGYFDKLGVDAIWITAPYEQIHGWVGGGSSTDGRFGHYSYHGYFPLDFTTIDSNYGTPALMESFVETAHTKGIRVIVDVVMNHLGYATLKDMQEFGFGTLKSGYDYSWTPSVGGNWMDLNTQVVDFTSSSTDWSHWWGQGWVRTHLDSGSPIAGYDLDGSGDLESCLLGLPDVKTSTTTADVSLAPLWVTKWTGEGRFGTEMTELSNYMSAHSHPWKPRYYIMKWLVDLVKNYGVDGFRIDTVKHVELDAWRELWEESNAALTVWRQTHGSLPGANWTDNFWMTGEHWDYFAGGETSNNYDYFGNHFNVMIDFSYQATLNNNLNSSYNTMDNTYAIYTDGQHLPYISSHDTPLFFNTPVSIGGKTVNAVNGDYDKQQKAGTLFLLTTGPIQIFYGDEYGREYGCPTDNWPDPGVGTRSSYNWQEAYGSKNAILTHWQKVGRFRRNHIAVGAGTHTKLSDNPYIFKREYSGTYLGISVEDKVVCALGVFGTVNVDVSSVWSNGTQLRDAYTGQTATVSNGSVTFTSIGTFPHDLLLIEEVR